MRLLVSIELELTGKGTTERRDAGPGPYFDVFRSCAKNGHNYAIIPYEPGAGSG